MKYKSNRVEAELFSEPSGNVRGYVTAFLVKGGKVKALAKCHILTDKAPAIQMDLKTALSTQELEEAIASMNEMLDKVTELHATP